MGNTESRIQNRKAGTPPMKKTLAVLLALLMIAPLFAACSENKENNDTGSTASQNQTAADGGTADDGTAEEEITRANYPDTLPDDLDFGGVQLNIISFGSDNCQKYDDKCCCFRIHV